MWLFCANARLFNCCFYLGFLSQRQIICQACQHGADVILTSHIYPWRGTPCLVEAVALVCITSNTWQSWNLSPCYVKRGFSIFLVFRQFTNIPNEAFVISLYEMKTRFGPIPPLDHDSIFLTQVLYHCFAQVSEKHKTHWKGINKL